MFDEILAPVIALLPLPCLALSALSPVQFLYAHRYLSTIGKMHRSTGAVCFDPDTGPTGLRDGNAATVGDPDWQPLGAPASNRSGNNARSWLCRGNRWLDTKLTVFYSNRSVIGYNKKFTTMACLFLYLTA